MDLLEVARFTTLPEAELVVALLRRHKIDARVADREMANSMPHLQVALGGLRVVAPDFQIVAARDIVARARKGEFDDAEDADAEWLEDHTPGRVGELHDHEIHGVMGSMKTVARVVIITILVLPLAGCLVLWLF